MIDKCFALFWPQTCHAEQWPIPSSFIPDSRRFISTTARTLPLQQEEEKFKQLEDTSCRKPKPKRHGGADKEHDNKLKKSQQSREFQLLSENGQRITV